jgi:hypothetical protein
MSRESSFTPFDARMAASLFVRTVRVGVTDPGEKSLYFVKELQKLQFNDDLNPFIEIGRNVHELHGIFCSKKYEIPNRAIYAVNLFDTNENTDKRKYRLPSIIIIAVDPKNPAVQYMNVSDRNWPTAVREAGNIVLYEFCSQKPCFNCVLYQHQIHS